MKPDFSCLKQTRTLGFLAVAVGTFLLVAALVGVMINLTRPQDTNAERVKLRHENLSQLRIANGDVLNNYAVLDPARGMIRLPIARAKELALEEWKDPAAGRANLLARLKKSTYVAPKNDFE